MSDIDIHIPGFWVSCFLIYWVLCYALWFIITWVVFKIPPWIYEKDVYIILLFRCLLLPIIMPFRLIGAWRGRKRMKEYENERGDIDPIKYSKEYSEDRGEESSNPKRD